MHKLWAVLQSFLILKFSQLLVEAHKGNNKPVTVLRMMIIFLLSNLRRVFINISYCKVVIV